MRREHDRREEKALEEIERLAWLARVVFGMPNATPVLVPAERETRRTLRRQR